MRGVVAMGNWRVGSVDGTMPPRMARVEGGRKTVECSWRGDRGIGGRECHLGVGEEDMMVREERKTRSLEECMLEVGIRSIRPDAGYAGCAFHF